MTGFKFRNTHSDSFGLGVKNIDRTLLPRKRNDEFTIPGRHGTLVFGDGIYDKRYVRMELYIINDLECEDGGNWTDFREKVRGVASWLSGSGLLIFDDEPDKAYNAEIYEDVGLSEWENYPVGTIQITFECQPFAESVYYNQVNQEVTKSGAELEAPVNGTQKTGCIITIKNTGTNTIQGITITRRGEV